MNDKFLKPYNPQETESRIYKLWEESGYFNPDNLPKRHVEPFAIIMPPTNANGDLHAGHSLVMTIEDIMIRFNRMMGKKTLWLPGNDHAGFETQVVYEKILEKEGRSRFNMDPDKLYKEIWNFTQKNRANINSQIKSMGASCDWSRERFTLDESVVGTVNHTFIKLFENSLIYRGKKIVSWCTKHQTSFSDLEILDEEKTDKFYYLKYGPFVIGTVRPETKFGDKYVVMHPDDKRYLEYKEGQEIKLEWINGPITATVVKDKTIDMEFGTGVMTITPWHDNTDFEIAERHHLDKEQIIDEQGRLMSVAGEFEGMKIGEAREKVVEKLKQKGLVKKIDEIYKHTVRTCYKCGTVIEPQIKSQWFLKMKPLAIPVIEAIEKGEIRYIPEYYKKIILHWLNNINDWNISRQIVWGIPIPAWFRNDEIEIGFNKPTGDGWHKDPDTFDTWFSSGQWPFAALDFPNSEDYKEFYPTQIMETAGEIIFFWIARMLMLGKYMTGKFPFDIVYLHGLVLDAKGKKMSKSKGNVINPLVLTSKYGTDALRMGLVIGNTPGTSLALSEDKIKAYKNFANKIWNIARYVLSQERSGELKKDLIDEFNNLVKDTTKDMEGYRFYIAAEKIYAYAWHRFADEILEESKKHGGYGETLYYILENFLKILHPFMPFITEEIWSELRNLPTSKLSNLLMIEPWPKND